MTMLPELTEEREAELLDNPKYEHLVLKNYRCWTLYLSENQSHFGRAFAWLTTRHVDFQPLWNLEYREYNELRSIMSDHFCAITRLTGISTIMNCEWLGNEFEAHRGHGHMHLIPRYEGIPTFGNRSYPDDRFGKRSLYGKRVLPPDELDAIRLAIQKKL